MRTLVYILLILTIAGKVKSQNCLYFDGINDRITADPTELNNIDQGNFTLEAWVQGDNDQPSSFPMIFSNRSTSNDGILFFFHSATNKELCLQMNGANLKLENNGGYGKILDGTRHHVAVSRNGEDLFFYVDGELIGEIKLWFDAPSLMGDGPLMIGYDLPTGNPMEGYLSNIRVWSIARSESEIKATMNLELPTNVPNLLINYPLNEGDGNTVNNIANGETADFGGEGMEITTYPNWDNDCESFTVPPESLGYCLSFDGDNDKAIGSSSAINFIGSTNFTMEAWIQSEGDNFTNFPMILSNRSASNNGMLFSFHNGTFSNPTKELYLQMNNTNYRLTDNGGAGNILDGNRHHVAISRDGTSLNFYIDGILRGSRNINSSDQTLSGNAPLSIGYDTPTGNPFSGILSNIRVWDIARTEAEIQSTMHTTLPIGVDNLVLNYPLNDGNPLGVLDLGSLTTATFGGDVDAVDLHPSWIADCITFTDIKENIHSTILNAYPNPASQYLYIELDKNYMDIEVSIYDYNGKLLTKKQLSNQSELNMDISHLPNNNYIVTLTTENNTSNFKLNVIK